MADLPESQASIEELLQSLSLGSRIVSRANPKATLPAKIVFIDMPLILRFYCDSDRCGPDMDYVFLSGGGHASVSELRVDQNPASAWQSFGIDYVCKHCQKSAKSFLLGVLVRDDHLAEVTKLAEYPPPGPPIPKKLLKLAGASRQLLRDGYLIERQGKGIGAFAYYRRVVETSKNTFLAEVKKLLELQGGRDADVAIIQTAIQEKSFDKAMSSVRDHIPTELYVFGKNPFTILHRATSKGLHEFSDAECLAWAVYVREVLIDFAERCEMLLGEKQGLKKAMHALEAIQSTEPGSNP